MISKIIQKEKERQDEHLKKWKDLEFSAEARAGCQRLVIFEHKQSLINLKEYLEGQLTSLKLIKELEGTIGIIQLKEDIKELNKMIKRYS